MCFYLFKTNDLSRFELAVKITLDMVYWRIGKKYPKNGQWILFLGQRVTVRCSISSRFASLEGGCICEIMIASLWEAL